MRAEAMHFRCSSREGASAAVIVALAWSESIVPRPGVRFCSKKWVFGPQISNKHGKRTQEQSGQWLAKKAAAGELKRAEETTLHFLLVQPTPSERGRKRESDAQTTEGGKTPTAHQRASPRAYLRARRDGFRRPATSAPATPHFFCMF